MSTRFLVHRWNSALAVIALVLSGAAHAGAPASPAESSWCAPRCDQLVIDWNQTAHQVFAAENGHADPLGASRTMAMMHLAMHDAVNAVQPRYAAYALRERAAGADAAVAAVTAAHDVLLALPSQASRSAEGAIAERSAGSRQGRCSRIRQIARCTRRTGNPRAARRRRQQRQRVLHAGNPRRRISLHAGLRVHRPAALAQRCSRSRCAIPRSSAWPRHRRSIAPPTPAPSRK